MLQKISKELEKYPETAKSQAGKIHVKGLQNIIGAITRSQFLIEDKDFKAIIDLEKDSIKAFYPAQIANYIIQEQL